jgi:hypothetical protein
VKLTKPEVEAFALELQTAYLGAYPYVSIAEVYWDKFGEDLPDDLGDEIYNLITSGDL